MIEPTPHQQRVLEVPEAWSMLLAGGRGGGKSTAASLLVLRHVEKYKKDARPLLIRETHKAVTELEAQLDALFHNAYGRGVKLNRADHLFRIPNGALVNEHGASNPALRNRRVYVHTIRHTTVGLHNVGKN